jgi:hypothetical protein
VCLQVWPWLRRRHPAIHRTGGRVYVFGGALPSAVLILLTLPYSVLRIGAVGGAIAGILWIATTVAGFRMARRRRYPEHRRWMVYSFALALNTVTGRAIFYLAMAIPGLGVDVLTLAEVAGFWLGWVVNLSIAHWWLRRTSTRAWKELV